MRIVTGYTGTEHITSNDDQGLNQAIFGNGSTVLPVGNLLAATLIDANTVNIADGEGMLQGVHFRVDPGTVDTVAIASGTVGYNRIDLICARYTKNAVTGVEAVTWNVIQGELSTTTPTEPSYTTGDVLSGNTTVDFPMYKVTITGVTPVVTRVYPMRPKERLTKYTQPMSSVATRQYYTADLDVGYDLPEGIYYIRLSAELINESDNIAGSLELLDYDINTIIESTDSGESHYEYVELDTVYPISSNNLKVRIQNKGSYTLQVATVNIEIVRII